MTLVSSNHLQLYSREKKSVTAIAVTLLQENDFQQSDHLLIQALTFIYIL